MKAVFNESDVRAIFKARWDGWLDTFQPGIGATVGVSDTQILVDGNLVPIELKWAEIDSGRIMPKMIRPGQIRWHTEFAMAGGTSFFIVGTDEQHMFITHAPYAIASRKTGLMQHARICPLLSFGKQKSADKIFSDSVRAFVRAR